MDESTAEALYTLSEAKVRQFEVAELRMRVRQMVLPLKPRLQPEQKSLLQRMLDEIAAFKGPPTAEQIDFLAAVETALCERDSPTSTW